MKTEVEIVPYGEVFSALSKQRWRTISHHTRISKPLERASQSHRRVFVTFSWDLDESFAKLFRQKSSQDTRLLILNEGASTDRLLSRIFDLQIRTPQRCYVFEAKFATGKTHFAAALIHSLLERLASGLEAEDERQRILDARIENGILHVVSPNFDRLDVPTAEIPALKNTEASKLLHFE